MDADTIRQIRQDVISAYGSLESPSWASIEKRRAANPYAGLIEAFSSIALVEDVSDPNDDVCIYLALRNDDGGVAVLLSLVGRYACILNADDQVTIQNLYERIANRIHDNDLKLLQPEVLAFEIDFSCQPTPIYSILFSSDEAISRPG